MAMLELKTKKRESKSSVEDGYIPAVFYGKTTENTSISIKKIDFKKIFEKAGESAVVSLKGDAETYEALIHDVQYNVLTEEPVHVDFYVFEKGKMIEVEIPLEFVGKSAAVSDLDGILVKVAHNLAIKAQPNDLPHNVEVDISLLVDMDSVIYAKDLKLPKGVELVVDADEVVCSVTVAKEEVEEAVEVDLESIEVEKKGKAEDDSEEGDKTESKDK